MNSNAKFVAGGAGGSGCISGVAIAHCDGGAGCHAGGAGGLALALLKVAVHVKAQINATTPACLTGAGGDANGGNAAAGGAGGIGIGGLGGDGGLAFGGDGGLGGVACLEPFSVATPMLAQASNAEAEVGS